MTHSNHIHGMDGRYVISTDGRPVYEDELVEAVASLSSLEDEGTDSVSPAEMQLAGRVITQESDDAE